MPSNCWDLLFGSQVTANEVLASPNGAAGPLSPRALVAGDIPSLDASIITSGVLALARGGNTFAALGDMIYGGVAAAPTVLSGNTTATKMYLSQTGAAGPVSAAPAWAQVNYADITGTTPTPPSGAVLWSAIGNAGANLTLSNAAYTTEFDQTSNAIWLWKNTTVATSGTTNASPLLEVAANYWTGAASAADTWSIGSSLAAGTNGISTLAIGHSGTTGGAQIQTPGGDIGTVYPSIIGSSNTKVGLTICGANGYGIRVTNDPGGTFLDFWG